MSRFYIYPTLNKVIACDHFYYWQFRHAFVYDTHGIEGHAWYVLFKGKLKRRTKEFMPKEFLMHLVLLGVTI